MNKQIKIREGEYWWGGSTAKSIELPLSVDSEYEIDMYNGANQTMPFFLSSQGRYIWSDMPMNVKLSGGIFDISSEADIILCEAGESLKDAYLAASSKHFPFSGKTPPLDFFETAQYNTWMEFDYNQTQQGVLNYARAIVKNGYKPGVIMIDEGWHTRYGLWEFDFAKFPNPKEMVDELHALGFKVMLWVVPLVTADGKDFVLATNPERAHLLGAANGKQLFLRTDDGSVAIIPWWNGFSAILNMCLEEDREFLDSRLRRLMNDYGVDGFKFDGGNISMYNPDKVINGKQTKFSADELNIAWNEFGARYEYHEYKDTFRGGGKSVIQRISDRDHKWVENGLATIIPTAITQGLIGHPFICPDMVGGGEWSFNHLPGFKCDEELFVRMAECSALFPMMQFSWAPWRMLGREAQGYCLDAARLHSRFAEVIAELVREAAKSGEPIVRHMEYEYPHSGYERVFDQFMLGKNILVAPVIKQGEVERELFLPEGKWLYLGEREIEGGGKVKVDAPLGVLPYFVKEK